MAVPTKMVEGHAQEMSDVVRLSFRKGGEKEAYRKMKVVLGMKAWERVVSLINRSRNSALRLGQIGWSIDANV